MINDLRTIKLDPIILRASEEDITDIDVSTKVIMQKKEPVSVELMANKTVYYQDFVSMSPCLNCWVKKCTT